MEDFELIYSRFIIQQNHMNYQSIQYFIKQVYLHFIVVHKITYFYTKVKSGILEINNIIFLSNYCKKTKT